MSSPSPATAARQVPTVPTERLPRRPEDPASLGLEELPEQKAVVYIGMSADLVHHGHINIVRVARAIGRRVVVGLLTDEAIASYKRKTIMKFEQRRVVVAALSGVDEVVAQTTLDYVPNLRRFRPDYVVHGSDWRNGVQCKARDDVVAALAEWGGRLVEPEYTPNISTTHIIRLCHQRERDRRAEERAAIAPEFAGSAADALAERVAVSRSAMNGAADDGVLERPVAYVAVTSDVMHHGVVTVIQEAAKHGRSVVVGLLSDDAAERLTGSRPAVPFAGRCDMYFEIDGVSRVVPQLFVDYRPNLLALKPEFVVHGDDWKAGEQRDVRAAVEETIKEWNGRLVETSTVTFEDIDQAIEAECYDRVEKPAAKK